VERLVRHLPSPALVVSCAALLVALTGAGYAARALPRNSVGPKQLKANAVTSPKIKNGSVAAADLAPGVLPPSKAVLRTRTAGVALGNTAGVLTTVLTATVVPAGSYVGIFRGDVVNFDFMNPTQAFHRCQLEAPTGSIVAGATTYAVANENLVNQMTIMQTFTLATAADIRVRCSHDQATSTSPYIENSRLLLVPVRTLDEAAVSG
jgi:hypothetical protein